MDYESLYRNRCHVPETVPDHRRALGERVRELRADRGWSQEGFAHHVGLDRTYVSGIERGVRNPTLDIIHQLAQGLGVEVADLFPR